ncbi:hypothetical protein BKN38_08965, partial [Helicobacter sp. CLO-3]|uniref:SEL1-like repeat protein n=3 Tax=unclassified Helicobacter TaxID=2593540 RepID=UPI0008DAF0E7
ITQRTKTIGKNKRIDYQFLLVLTDLKSGRVVWDTDETISKLADAKAEMESGAESTAKALERKCISGSDEACWDLMKIYYKENNYGKAADFAIKACDRGVAAGCAISATAYIAGMGVEQDKMKAVEYSKKACDGGHARSCGYLASLYLEGEDVKQDYAKVRIYAQKACDSDVATGCSILATCYVAGLGVKENYTKAKEFYGKACELGDNKETCEFYKYLRDAGF